MKLLYYYSNPLVTLNDIDTNLKTCEMILYADDSVFYVANKKCEEIEKKQSSDLEQIANWFIENNL